MVLPYITFSGECKKALEFYETAFHTSVSSIQYYGEYEPEDAVALPDNLKDWVLHAEMEICGTKFWFADEVAETVCKGNMVKLTAVVQDAKEAQRIFDVLQENAQITLPPTETFYSSFHAGIVDKFGISWNITALEAPVSANK